MAEKRGRGRPELPEGEGKSSYIGFRVADEDRERMEAAASAANLLLSDWCRAKLIAAARRESKRSGLG